MLLDSLWRGRYIPPVVFALVDEDGEDVKRCVDGKQRLTSIQNFLDGMVRFIDHSLFYHLTLLSQIPCTLSSQTSFPVYELKLWPQIGTLAQRRVGTTPFLTMSKVATSYQSIGSETLLSSR